MTSSFNVQVAAGYEQLMGRWSRRLAPLFIDFTGIADGEASGHVSAMNRSSSVTPSAGTT